MTDFGWPFDLGDDETLRRTLARRFLAGGRSVMHSAPDAARIAGITYRRLDHWHRQDWIVATETRARHRRYYDEATIVRLAALGHLTYRGGLDVAAYGPRVARVRILPGQALAVDALSGGLFVFDTPDLLRVVTGVGRWVVFDPTPTLRRLATADALHREHEASR